MFRAILIFLFFLIPFSSSVNFQVSRFSLDDWSVLLEGDSVISFGDVELTNIVYSCRVGRVIYNGKVPLWDDSGRLGNFTTHFSFTIDTQNRPASQIGNGLAFFLAPAGFQIPPNSVGGFLGIFNTSTTDTTRTQILTVEFDTFSNEWDPPYQHVGINLNSVTSLNTTPWNVTLHSGDLADVWIDYNSFSRNLSVLLSYGNGTSTSLSYIIDLREVLTQWVTIGISAATGVNYERHILSSWEFNSSLDIKENDGNGKRIELIVGLSLAGFIVFIAVIAAAAFLMLRKKKLIKSSMDRRNNPEGVNLTSINDDLERGAGPKRFSYKDLATATNNFAEERKLGEGGFGGVYKGHLIDLDIPIAVKRISRGSRQGKKEYITEVKIISMLRHRNLVQLIGWCHDQGEFLLVYEFMPNRSLDYHLFGRKNNLFLSWSVRYKIAQGLASALLYLHEEWDQCVVHRDIKSSNVMLDSNFNVKLGDFGLARLMDHELGPQTTGLAGTLGYMAPEYISTGRASKESDVYSFGVVALEIATGRKSVSPSDKENAKGLVEWVWELYGDGQLISGVDKRLQLDSFEQKQVECLMIVGLWCAHPDRNPRPSIRQASHVLNFEAELPLLPAKMPVPMYFVAPSISWVSSGGASVSSSSINVGR